MANAGNRLLVQWYPKGTLEELIRHDEKKEYTFRFKIEDLKKAKAKDNFCIKYNGKRSFTFWVDEGEKPQLKCRVSNLPEDTDTAKPPGRKITDGCIQVTVKKTTKNNWDSMLGPDLPWVYPDLIDIE